MGVDSWFEGYLEEGSMAPIPKIDAASGLIDPATSLPIPAVAPYAWSDFISAGFDLTQARRVAIIDKKVQANGGFPLFQIDPTATTQKRILDSNSLYVDTVANMNSLYPAASWPGLIVYLGAISARLISNGTRYVPINGEVLLFQGVYGTLAAPTKNTSTGTTYTFSIGTPTIPANLLAVGDMLTAGFRTQRHNANATISHKMTLGTAGTNSDASVWAGSIPATDVAITTAHCEISIGSATVFTTNSSGTLTGTGGAGIAVDSTTNFNIASDMILGLNGAKNTADTLDLLHFYLKWSAK